MLCVYLLLLGFKPGDDDQTPGSNQTPGPTLNYPLPIWLDVMSCLAPNLQRSLFSI